MKFNLHQNHPFHLVSNSPWPLLSSLRLINLLIGAIIFFHEYSNNLFFIRFISLSIISFQWWRDVTRERTFQGNHTSYVLKLIQLGIILFIISEIFFFLSIFWRFFHSSLSPNIEIGIIWPPLSIKMLNPYNIPLLNTIILLSSGISITWRHWRIINKNFKFRYKSLLTTIILGVLFSFFQFIEYKEISFSLSDSIYGSTFFIITGFHGIHVTIGTIFIFIRFNRLKNLHFSPSHHFGFEARSWYWHFVDIIWLFVYIFVYWWSF